jgi:hypothetical protein
VGDEDIMTEFRRLLRLDHPTARAIHDQFRESGDREAFQDAMRALVTTGGVESAKSVEPAEPDSWSGFAAFSSRDFFSSLADPQQPLNIDEEEEDLNPASALFADSQEFNSILSTTEAAFDRWLLASGKTRKPSVEIEGSVGLPSATAPRQ